MELQPKLEDDDDEPPMRTDETSNNGAKDEELESARQQSTLKSPRKRNSRKVKEEDEDEQEEDEEPVKKRIRRRGPEKDQQSRSETKISIEAQDNALSKTISSKAGNKSQVMESSSKPKASKLSDASPKMNGTSKKKETPQKAKPVSVEKDVEKDDEPTDAEDSELGSEHSDPEEDAGKASRTEKAHSTLKASGKDPYPDWKAGVPVPYAALCTTFSLIEMTSKRLIIMAHCSFFLRQVLRLTPQDLLSTIQLMINKLAADYAGIELGIGESLIMKAIGESTGRSLQVIKADQAEIGDLGLVAAKSRSNQPTMFKPKPLTVKGVLDGLMSIATTSGDGSQGRKIAGIKKLLSAADTAHAGKGSKGIDITKDKGGASESKFIIRFLEGKLRLGLAEKTVLVSLAHAMVSHEVEKQSRKQPSSEKISEGEAILKTVYR